VKAIANVSEKDSVLGSGVARPQAARRARQAALTKGGQAKRRLASDKPPLHFTDWRYSQHQSGEDNCASLTERRILELYVAENHCSFSLNIN